jgi:hypothetical protein
MTFASKSLTEHLVRGFFGFTALVSAFLVMMHGSAWSTPIALVGVALLRGCPTCWTVGWMEAWSARSTAKICRDGSCEPASKAP